jgi:hypothetical protein
MSLVRDNWLFWMFQNISFKWKRVLKPRCQSVCQCLVFHFIKCNGTVNKLLKTSWPKKFEFLKPLMDPSSSCLSLNISQWKGINRKQINRWQHLSRLKASTFFSLLKKISCYETQQLILGTGTAIWWVTEPH